MNLSMLRRLPATLLASLAMTLSLTSTANAQDATGDWKGVLSLTPDLQVRIAIHLKPNPHGGMDGAIDSPDQGVYGKPIVATVANGKLSFTDAAINAQYAATWDPTAHAWTGIWRQAGREIPLALTAGAYPPPSVIAGLDGEWDGALDMGTGLRLRLAFHIKTGPRGTLATVDSVDQGAYGGGVSDISRDGDHVQLRMNLINALFDARLSDSDQTLAGIFTQNAQALPLLLKRLPPGAPAPWPRPSIDTDVAAAPTGDWKIPTDAEIHDLLARRIDTERQGVGAVVGIVDGHGRRVVAYGKSDADRPLDGDTEFEIGSITKVFTSLVLADMVGKGEVKLEDPIAKYLPPAVSAPQKDGKPITLVDLATHTSGLPRMPDNFAPKDLANPYADYAYDQLWRFLASYQLTRDPGAQWEYSNLGFGLLGDLLARRAGTDYETLVKARVIDPLGMASTTITLTPDERARLAVGHNSSLQKVANWDLASLAGAGALRSTANDLMSFLAAAMGLAATPPTAGADFAATLAVTRPSGTPSMSQALGWEILHSPAGDIVEHGGGTGGYHTFIAYNPKTRVGVVMLTNAETVAGADDIALHILTGSPVRALPPPAAPPPERHTVNLDAKAMDALVGRYALSPQMTVAVTRDGEHLMAQLTGQSAFEIFPESPTEVFWKVVDAQATFTLGQDGRARSVTLHQGGRDLPAPRTP
jgi:D-alanyl-D-alanine-carboxypeptidase/D-alanyl-D-alanine-endopeptidase